MPSKKQTAAKAEKPAAKATKKAAPKLDRDRLVRTVAQRIASADRGTDVPASSSLIGLFRPAAEAAVDAVLAELDQ